MQTALVVPQEDGHQTDSVSDRSLAGGTSPAWSRLILLCPWVAARIDNKWKERTKCMLRTHHSTWRGSDRLRLSVPLYGSHLRKWRTESRESKTRKKVSGLSWNSTTTEHAHLCQICPTTILICPFQSTAWNTIVTPCCVPHLTALRESRYTGAWFRSLFINDYAHF